MGCTLRERESERAREEKRGRKERDGERERERGGEREQGRERERGRKREREGERERESLRERERERACSGFLPSFSYHPLSFPSTAFLQRAQPTHGGSTKLATMQAAAAAAAAGMTETEREGSRKGIPFRIWANAEADMFISNSKCATLIPRGSS
jgi:hypothetical protein